MRFTWINKMWLLAVVFLGACVSHNPNPKVALIATYSASEPYIPVTAHKLLVVFDARLEHNHLKSNNIVYKNQQDLMDNWSEVRQSYALWGLKNNVPVDVKIIVSDSELHEISKAKEQGYSHILLEIMTKMMVETDNHGSMSSNREWLVTIMQPDSLSKNKTLYASKYQSDGIDCFRNGVLFKTRCQKNYFSTLSQHLKIINTGWSDLVLPAE